jgi:aspartyl-tRNA(Asn)/glutamyl-tRNA(Gln) amidotransferase subunit A
MDAATLGAAIAAGELSSVELTRACLDQIAATDDRYHAFLHVAGDQALAAAAAVDAAVGAGDDLPSPLAGVPLALKDVFTTTDMPTTCGSKILQGWMSPYDATVTARIRDAGIPILGKTNMDEFAMGSSTEFSAYKKTVNPWATDRVPGGSSGGSSAAVAAFHAPLSIGTDTGGSIRQPASLTGIVGMKPTYGRVSRYGIVAFASSLDQVGPFARTAQDAALLLHAIAGADAHDATSSRSPLDATLLSLPSGDAAASAIRGKRFALPKEYFVAGMEAGVERAVRDAVAALEAAGGIVEEVSLPTTEHALATYYIVAPAEASANLARYDGVRYGASKHGGGDLLNGYLETRGRGFGPEVRRRIMLGTYALSAGYYDAYYVKAQKVRTLIARDFDRIWAAGFDAIVAPTSPQVAWKFGAKMSDPVSMYLADACTLPANMAGLPGVSIPCGLSENLPVGLQLIGKPWSEAELLSISAGYEALTATAAWRAVAPHDLAKLGGGAA